MMVLDFWNHSELNLEFVPLSMSSHHAFSAAIFLIYLIYNFLFSVDSLHHGVLQRLGHVLGDVTLLCHLL